MVYIGSGCGRFDRLQECIVRATVGSVGRGAGCGIDMRCRGGTEKGNCGNLGLGFRGGLLSGVTNGSNGLSRSGVGSVISGIRFVGSCGSRPNLDCSNGVDASVFGHRVVGLVRQRPRDFGGPGGTLRDCLPGIDRNEWLLYLLPVVVCNLLGDREPVLLRYLGSVT